MTVYSRYCSTWNTKLWLTSILSIYWNKRIFDCYLVTIYSKLLKSKWCCPIFTFLCNALWTLVFFSFGQCIFGPSPIYGPFGILHTWDTNDNTLFASRCTKSQVWKAIKKSLLLSWYIKIIVLLLTLYYIQRIPNGAIKNGKFRETG
jgi:hypothetical protein